MSICVDGVFQNLTASDFLKIPDRTEMCIDFSTVHDLTTCDFMKVPTNMAENVDLMMSDGFHFRDSEDCTDEDDVDISEYHLSYDSGIECDFYDEKGNPKDRDAHFRSETNAGGKRRRERKRKHDVTNDGSKATAKAKRKRGFGEEAERVQSNIPFCDDYNTFCWLQYGFNSLFEKFRDEVKSPYASILDFNSDHAMFSICFAECVPLGQVTSIHKSSMFVQRRKNTIEMIEAHRGSYNLRYSVIDANELPWPDGTFDIVFASESLKDYQDPVKALVEMKRVCKPGGTLIVFERIPGCGDQQNVFTIRDQIWRIQNGYNYDWPDRCKEWPKEYLGGAGFKDEDIRIHEDAVDWGEGVFRTLFAQDHFLWLSRTDVQEVLSAGPGNTDYYGNEVAELMCWENREFEGPGMRQIHTSFVCRNRSDDEPSNKIVETDAIDDPARKPKPTHLHTNVWAKQPPQKWVVGYEPSGRTVCSGVRLPTGEILLS